jgi:hypothetical protein
MNKTDEALKLALEALLAATPVKAKDPQMQAVAIAALQEALAAPTPEPFGWWFTPNGEFLLPTEVEVDNPRNYKTYRAMFIDTPPAAPKVVDCHANGVCVQSGLRAEMSAPVPLTDEQAKQLLKDSDLLEMFENIGWYSSPRKAFNGNGLKLIRAAEAAHGIKENT